MRFQDLLLKIGRTSEFRCRLGLILLVDIAIRVVENDV